MASKKLTPYQRIIEADQRGKGLRLTAKEVFTLAIDEAIIARAQNDNEPDEEPFGKSWVHKKIEENERGIRRG